MFQGLRAVIYQVDDIEQAKAWYSSVVGLAPYFDEPFNAGFNAGGFELGLDPDQCGASEGNNEVGYWGTEDAEGEMRRLIELGAEEHRGVEDV